jgi:hypothetical protein
MSAREDLVNEFRSFNASEGTANRVVDALDVYLDSRTDVDTEVLLALEDWWKSNLSEENTRKLYDVANRLFGARSGCAHAGNLLIPSRKP